MQTIRSTRSSILGKRGHQTDILSSPSSHCDDSTIPTPEQTPNPKRARISISELDGDANKENVAPFHTNASDPPPSNSPRAARALRRSSTDISTPSRSRTTPRRNASTSNLFATPTIATSRLTLATPPPTPPTSLMPIHTRARALLRATCNSTAQVAGRDLERSTIHKFVTSFTQPRSPGNDGVSTLYISGSPGTGKTALVNSVLRTLDTTMKVMSINCMALNSVDALWDHLLEEFGKGTRAKTVGKGKKKRGKEGFEMALSGLGTKCIIVLDELDHIAASFQSLVSLFSLPQSNSSTLRMIGIANTHTLTSSMTQFSLHGITGVETLHFAPYTSSQLLKILQTRLAPLYDAKENFPGDEPKKFLPVATLTLLTKKIAAQTGDVRSLFEVLRGAIDSAVTSTALHASAVDANPLNTPAPVVTPTHILTALKAYAPAAITRSTSSVPVPLSNPLRGAISSETVTKVRNLGLQARLVLLSILLASKRLDNGLSLAGSSPPTSPSKSAVKTLPNSNASSMTPVDIDTTQLHAYYSTVLTRADQEVFTPVSRSEFTDLLGVLETVGLVWLSSSFVAPGSPSKTGRRTFGRSASFGSAGSGKDRGQEVRMIAGVRRDEVLRGMGIDVAYVKAAEGNDIREEEIRAIWEREKARLGRDVKARGRVCGGDRGDTFDGAMEN